MPSGSAVFDFLEEMQELIDDYYLELIFAFIVILYGGNYIIGRSTNMVVAKTWVEQNKEVFQQNFKVLGMTSDPNDLIEREKTNLFRFNASGRPNCHFANVTIETKRRHDLVTMFLWNLFSPEKDKVTIEVIYIVLKTIM